MSFVYIKSNDFPWIQKYLCITSHPRSLKFNSHLISFLKATEGSKLPPPLLVLTNKEITTGKKRGEGGHVKDHLSRLPPVLKPIRQPADKTTWVWSLHSGSGNKDGVKTRLRPLFSAPDKSTFKRLRLVWFLSVHWCGEELVEALALGPRSWQLPGWCYRRAGPRGPDWRLATQLL